MDKSSLCPRVFFFFFLVQLHLKWVWNPVGHSVWPLSLRKRPSMKNVAMFVQIKKANKLSLRQETELSGVCIWTAWSVSFIYTFLFMFWERLAQREYPRLSEQYIVSQRVSRDWMRWKSFQICLNFLWSSFLKTLFTSESVYIKHIGSVASCK